MEFKIAIILEFALELKLKHEFEIEFEIWNFEFKVAVNIIFSLLSKILFLYKI